MIDWPEEHSCPTKRFVEINRYITELAHLRTKDQALFEFDQWAMTQPEGNLLCPYLRKLLEGKFFGKEAR